MLLGTCDVSRFSKANKAIESILYTAVVSNKPEIVEFLLSKGIRPEDGELVRCSLASHLSHMYSRAANQIAHPQSIAIAEPDRCCMHPRPLRYCLQDGQQGLCAQARPPAPGGLCHCVDTDHHASARCSRTTKCCQRGAQTNAAPQALLLKQAVTYLLILVSVYVGVANFATFRCTSWPSGCSEAIARA